MAQVYFRCSSTNGGELELDAEVNDLTEAREHAAQVVRSILAIPSPEDWRRWELHACDELGDELFAIPFSSVIGSLH
jgi:hypothetical protein